MLRLEYVLLQNAPSPVKYLRVCTRQMLIPEKAEMSAPRELFKRTAINTENSRSKSRALLGFVLWRKRCNGVERVEQEMRINLCPVRP